MQSQSRSAWRTETWGMLPTPFDRHGAVDEPSLIRLARSFAGFTCTDLVLFGVIAEPETLSIDEKIAIIRTVRRAVPDVRVTAAVLARSGEDGIREVRALAPELLPSDRIMTDLIDSDPARQRAHFDAVRDAGGARDLVLQDYTGGGGARMAIDDLVTLLADTPSVVAVKEETAPTFDRIRRLVEIPHLTVLGGLGGANLVDDLLAGAHGLALGVSVPERLVQALWRFQGGDLRAAAAEVATLAGLISFETQPGRSVGIRKEHWRRRGVIECAQVRRPGAAWTNDLEPHSAFHLAAVLGTGLR